VVVPRTGADFEPEGAGGPKVLHELAIRLRQRGRPRAPPRGIAAHLGLDLRRRRARRRSLAYRMPEAVAAYIREHRLYEPPS
jgi:hypothetical protein